MTFTGSLAAINAALTIGLCGSRDYTGAAEIQSQLTTRATGSGGALSDRPSLHSVSPTAE